MQKKYPNLDSLNTLLASSMKPMTIGKIKILGRCPGLKSFDIVLNSRDQMIDGEFFPESSEQSCYCFKRQDVLDRLGLGPMYKIRDKDLRVHVWRHITWNLVDNGLCGWGKGTWPLYRACMEGDKIVEIRKIDPEWFEIERAGIRTSKGEMFFVPESDLDMLIDWERPEAESKTEPVQHYIRNWDGKYAAIFVSPFSPLSYFDFFENSVQQYVYELFMSEESILYGQWIAGRVATEQVAETVASRIGIPSTVMFQKIVERAKALEFPQQLLNFTCRQRAHGSLVGIVTANTDLFSRLVVPTLKLEAQFDFIINSADLGLANRLDILNTALEQQKLVVKVSECLLVDSDTESLQAFKAMGGKVKSYENDQEFYCWCALSHFFEESYLTQQLFDRTLRLKRKVKSE
ncbi:MAG: hypothetical protein K1X79_13580 [Oligoflexia bacterium]|nr:hypothetical protein [Oligoflexia bacterium]